MDKKTIIGIINVDKKTVDFFKATSKKISFVFFCATCIYFLVMFIGAFNFLTVVSVAIAITIPVILILQYLAFNKMNLWIWASYIVIAVGNLVFYIVWGAEPFGRRLWYNLVLSFLPIGLGIFLYYLPRITKGRALKVSAVLVLFFMTAANTLYFLALSIRVRPRVESMQEGHDKYLSSINDYTAGSPNVLVVLMDDMGYSDISCFSYLGAPNATIKTPTLDALAQDGVVMENFYASSPVCSPSRFSLLTGRYCSRGYLDQVVFPTVVSFDPMGDTRYLNPVLFSNNIDGLLGDEITVAEALQNSGYNTGLFGKWNLGDYGEYLPTKQGFDYFYGSYYVNDMTPYNWVREENGQATEVKSHAEIKDQSETTKFLTAEVNSFITNAVDNDDKFFAYYATPWPHYPIYSGVKGDPSDDSYIDCIEEFDTYLGDIIQNLKTKGVYDDTLIIFTSDNGPGREGASGALRGRKGTTFEGGQKVPFIATYKNGGIGSGAGFAGGNTIKTSAMNIDLFPTILHYAGIDHMPDDRIIDGKNLSALLDGTSNQPIHDSLYYIGKGKVLAVQKPLDLNGKTHAFKYYESVRSENTAFFDQVYRNYLFNLTTDPIEAYNISMMQPEIAEMLKADLLRFRKELSENRRGIIRNG